MVHCAVYKGDGHDHRDHGNTGNGQDERLPER